MCVKDHRGVRGAAGRDGGNECRRAPHYDSLCLPAGGDAEALRATPPKNKAPIQTDLMLPIAVKECFQDGKPRGGKRMTGCSQYTKTNTECAYFSRQQEKLKRKKRRLTTIKAFSAEQLADCNTAGTLCTHKPCYYQLLTY